MTILASFDYTSILWLNLGKSMMLNIDLAILYELNGSLILTRRGGTDANTPESTRKAILRDWHVGILAPQILEIHVKLYQQQFKNKNDKFGILELNDIREIRDGGGNGSIIGRNTFQRPRSEALNMLSQIIDIYKGKN